MGLSREQWEKIRKFGEDQDRDSQERPRSTEEGFDWILSLINMQSNVVKEHAYEEPRVKPSLHWRSAR